MNSVTPPPLDWKKFVTDDKNLIEAAFSVRGSGPLTRLKQPNGITLSVREGPVDLVGFNDYTADSPAYNAKDEVERLFAERYDFLFSTEEQDWRGTQGGLQAIVVRDKKTSDGPNEISQWPWCWPPGLAWRA
jgi:hypothetical protein